MSTITFQRFHSSHIAYTTLEGIAHLYCSVWKEPPWNEEFWNPQDVINTLKTEMEKPCATLVVAMDNTSVVGFTWGYEVSRSELEKIVGTPNLSYLFQADTRVGYVDELAVAKEYRGLRIGNHLSTALIKHLQHCAHTHIVLRTDEKAEPARRLYTSLGFTELCVRDAQYTNRSYWLLRQ